MYRNLYILFFITFVANSRAWDIFNLTLLEEKDHDVNKMAEKYGYGLETHKVVTEDGYILSLHRLLRRARTSRRKDPKSISKVVYLCSGLIDVGVGWMAQGPKKSLAYMLADKGYDVWMGNARGSKYSLSHKTLDSSMPEFWDFGWEEMGLYDVPANVDYILNNTGAKRLLYVGYSIGTTTYFVMTSMKPEYNDKIELMISVAPAVFMGNSRLSKINSLPVLYILNNILRSNKKYTVSSLLNRDFAATLCKMSPMFCREFITIANGPHNISDALWPVVTSYSPSGATSLELIHYSQLINSKRFCRFDYGVQKNIEKYGQPTPPDFDLAAVTSPVVLIYSEADIFTASRDAEILKEHLPNVVGFYDVQSFSHLDYIYAESSADTIYPYIIEYFEHIQEQYNNFIE